MDNQQHSQSMQRNSRCMRKRIRTRRPEAILRITPQHHLRAYFAVRKHHCWAGALVAEHSTAVRLQQAVEMSAVRSSVDSSERCCCLRTDSDNSRLQDPAAPSKAGHCRIAGLAADSSPVQRGSNRHWLAALAEVVCTEKTAFSGALAVVLTVWPTAQMPFGLLLGVVDGYNTSRRR